MIPAEISVIHRLVAAQFHKCLLEFFSTNNSSLWILQLRHEDAGNRAFLLNMDNFAAFCVGLKQCIDTALQPARHLGADMMVNTIAQDLATNTPDAGGISIISTWGVDKTVQFHFYPNQRDRKLRITLIYGLQDAMELYNRPHCL